MAIAAVIFLTLGILIIGFGLLSLSNIFNLPLTDEQSKRANLVTTKFQSGNARIMLVGGALLAIGLLLFWLAGA